ncbi:MAG TPA: hypothetical protein VH092_33935 [Urbifossiella sp.]|jgi:hypothetical protein|nr:hypothetical protein [Urbifossiella sp.]
MTDDSYRRPGDPAARLSELRSEKRWADPPPVAEEVEEEGGGPGESFSMRSADRRQKVMLEFRRKTGDATALAYSYLVRADLDPSGSIVLDFAAYVVQIEGRNLRPLYSGLVVQQVAVVAEVDEIQAEATVPRDKTVVTRIEVREKG